MFKKVLSEKILSPLSECFMVIDIMSDLGTLSLSSIIRWKACKSTLQATYILDRLNGNQTVQKGSCSTSADKFSVQQSCAEQLLELMAKASEHLSVMTIGSLNQRISIPEAVSSLLSDINRNDPCKIILKPEIHVMSWIMEKRSNIEDSAQEFHKNAEMVYTGSCYQENECSGVNNCEQGASFPLGLTLELYRELLDSIVTWTMSCKQFSSDLQRAAWFMGGSSK